MFAHTCTACHRRELIFPSQITGMESTEHGIVVSFTCWCDAEQTMVTGVRATEAPATAPAAAA
ncbi:MULTISPECIES: hypothetical protein [unclassified Nocardioides]|uniref:hypothetical protein n=1 Tax=unclassified Nocardioides TaxID=2615069 RepID=UPI00115397A5|nr:MULTISPECIES: hypothetical protein [unclassified Nocardioides]TQK68276.1 hypothetical protein FBY23_0023 [Nocardioides sp. SLBN-35]WGY02406.1 hypothetical protein QI633_01305 [Nocardioides sp. QY071]